MKRTPDFAQWLIAHTMYWALLYGAFWAQLEAALYVIKFITWVMAPLSLLLLTDQSIASSTTRPAHPPLRNEMAWLQSWITLGCLVWFGHFFSGLAYGFFMLMCFTHQDAVRKLRAANAEAAP